jgi:uncharacterized protein (DUF2141 family)
MRPYLAAILMLGLLVVVWFATRPSDEALSLSVAQQTQNEPTEEANVQLLAKNQAAEPTYLEDELGIRTPAGESGDLTVRISGLRPQGDVLVAVFEKAGGFPNRDNAARTSTLPVTDNNANVQFENLPPGDYAVAIFQDLNDDGVLNKSDFGEPIEPYGFSNDARGGLGPPSFQAAAFTLARGGKDVDVTVR